MSQTDITTATELTSVFERLGAGAGDALTDEMVSRLAETVSNGMTLLDEINRSGLAKALPVLSRMVESGDLERLAHGARLVGSAQDALTEEMIGRLVETLGGGLTLLDKAHRGGLERAITLMDRLMSGLTPSTVDRLVEVVPRLVQLLGHLEPQYLLEDAVGSVEKAVQDAGRLPRPTGGLRGLWALLKQGEIQEMLQLGMLFVRHFRTARARRNRK